MNRTLSLVASLKITCACIFWLFVLTFWGTVAQVGNGLYQAQERFFYSWFFRPQFFLPLPGAQLTMWVLFFNLTASTWLQFQRDRDIRSAGLKLTHLGILLYLFAAFLTFVSSEESYLNLREGQGSNVSVSYGAWEVAYWTDTGPARHVKAVDADRLKPGRLVPFAEKDFQLKLVQFYPNCEAFTKDMVSVIASLEPRPIFKEAEKNIAGGVFELTVNGQTQSLLLYGGDTTPVPIMVNGRTYHVILQHKRYQLPFLVQLKKFHVEFYPRTQTAKSYESDVLVRKDRIERPVRIYMNNPLSEKDFTLFQASYSADPSGLQSSTLAVVKNSARGWPYVACFVVLAGLILHFVLQAFGRKKPLW